MSVKRVLLLGGMAAAAMLCATPAGALPAPRSVPRVVLPSPPSVGVAPVDHALTTVGPLPPLTSALPGPVAGAANAAGPAANVVPSRPTALLPEASRPALPTDPPRPETPPRSMQPDARSRARGLDATGGRFPAAEHERADVAPAVKSAEVDARPVGVRGALDARSNANPLSPLGTAATSFALWVALCALALVARGIVISSWRDAPRRRRAFSLR